MPWRRGVFRALWKPKRGKIGPAPLPMALVNVAIHRHSGSAEAWVRLSSGKGLVGFEVRDKGRGIGELNSSNAHKMGVGIRRMRERVRLLGGILEISQANPGTSVSVKLPLKGVGEGQKNNKGESGLDVARRISVEKPDLCILIFTMHGGQIPFEGCTECRHARPCPQIFCRPRSRAGPGTNHQWRYVFRIRS